MRKLFLSALMLGAALMVSAQSKYDHYYEGLPIEIEHVQEVKFPATSVNIAQYGAFRRLCLEFPLFPGPASFGLCRVCF